MYGTTLSGVNASITFPAVAGRTYTLKESTELLTWEPVLSSIAPISGPFTFGFGPVNTLPRYFQRVRVSR